MPFFLPRKCKPFFSQIFDQKNRSGTKLRLYFDEYYFCLMVGLAAEKYDENAELEHSEITDRYPAEYADSREYIAGLLFATERSRLQDVSEPGGRKASEPVCGQGNGDHA